MARLGSWWLAREQLLTGEQVRHSWNANLRQSKARAVGGKLFATTHRLVFLPHKLDAITGGHRWTAELGQVVYVGPVDAGGDFFSGGLRNRMQISTANGASTLFVINGMPRVINELVASLPPR